MSIRLNQQRKSHISSLPEAAAPLPRRVRWARLMYYGLILSIVAYLVFYAANQAFFIRAAGVLSPEQIVVKAPHRSLLTRVDVGLDQQIEAGNALFSARRVSEGIDNALSLERLRAARDAEQKRAMLQVIAAELRNQEALREKLKTDRVLELNRDRLAQAPRVDIAIAELRARIAALRAEVAAYDRFGRELAGEEAQLQKALDYTVAAAGAGRVVSVGFKPSEYVREGEPVVILEDPARYRVQAYFEPSAVQYITPGKAATLRFPDGAEVDGRVRRVFSAADEEARPLRRDYQPIEAHAVVEIEPSHADAARLTRFRNMEVSVHMRRWQ